MANDEFHTGRWVDERLAGLDDSADWNPNAARGLARVRERQRAARRHRIEWIVATLAGAAACVLLVLLQSPGACAHPRGCLADTSGSPVPSVDFGQAGYKESGSPLAPVVIEIYTDYECSPCSAFYRDVLPQLKEKYVATGKVRLVERDFPLSIHPHAREAARYANAAGSLGKYDAVVKQLFETQSMWQRDGNVDLQVAQVLTPEEMNKVRALAVTPQADSMLAAEIGLAARNRISQTPSLVVAVNGNRRTFVGVPQFATLQEYLDQLVAR